MSTTEMPETENLAPEQNPGYVELLQEAFSMSGEGFMALKVANRDLVLFLLLREIASTVNGFETRLNALEDKARVLASPEGMQNVLNMFLGGGAGNGNMGKMLMGMIGK